VFAFGTARFLGSAAGTPLHAAVVGMTATPDGRGYWLVSADGGVFAFGTARFFGSAAGTPLGAPVVGIGAASNGAGYWLAAADGDVLAFGSAPGKGTRFGTFGGRTAAISDARDTCGYRTVTDDGFVGAFRASHAPPLAVALTSPAVGID